MKLVAIAAAVLLFSMGCNDAAKQGPDISSIQLETPVARFDEAYFSIDSLQMERDLNQLNIQFPNFFNDFTQHILGAGAWSANNELARVAHQRFYSSYLPVYQMTRTTLSDLKTEEKELNTALRYLHYYYPDYRIPRLIAYLGPFDAPGVAITDSALAIGLQLYAGNDFSFYTSQQGQELFPLYISRRFEKKYIAANAVNAVLDDIYPDQSSSLPLLEKMIERGKYWWAKKQLLPNTPDSIITGYTQQQLDFCAGNEGFIWSQLLQSDYLYTTDPSIVPLFLGDAPGTQGFPPAAPGNIGQWIGWRIVQAYASKQEQIHPDKLMKTPARDILDQSKYKPR